ncbi:YdeI/OmpD-associated family protein [Streptomyces sp. NBC_00525]|uniref:YdeI/OmpD-associated family protein n=1 Tax=Streptomyces sp. NBC_00525 TaxID=2903660 RepID=UPI002E810B02|nr:YdeI/OmpD-associated family protein [Streptomyces sp. NBC_00525]WUC92476.1 YdeI/OmpD-associated family protein [Streptomyces sp. NBC_00525]
MTSTAGIRENAETFTSAAHLENWLAEHHADSAGVWMRIAKRNSGVASVTVDEYTDALLCYGWITGQRKSCDEVYYLQRITPRRPRSVWSLVNVEKAEALIEDGRMRAPGLAEIEAARADGRWEAAYPSQSRATVPADLAEALAADEVAGRFYAGLGRSDRYLVLLRLMTAPSPEVRAARLDRAVAAMAQGRKAA